jgi:hypothetical protein
MEAERLECVVGSVVEVGERDRRRPAGVAVVQDHGEDGRQPLALGLVGQEPVPDPKHVAQEPERHDRVAAALVLDEQVDERGTVAAAKRRLEQEVGVAAA